MSPTLVCQPAQTHQLSACSWQSSMHPRFSLQHRATAPPHYSILSFPKSPCPAIEALQLCMICPLIRDFKKSRLHLLKSSKVFPFFYFFSKQLATNRKSISQCYCKLHISCSNMSYATVSFVTKKCFCQMVLINKIK